METAARAEGWHGRGYGERTPAGFPLNSTSQALEASRIVKAGAATLYGLSGFNSGAAQFVLIFDTATLPPNNAVPVMVLSVSAAQGFSADAGYWGRSFSRGIVIANSSTAATLTIGAASCWFDVQYA